MGHALPTAQATLLIFVILLVRAVAANYPIGLLADRWGRRRLALLSVAVEAVGLVAFSFSRSAVALAVTGIAWVAFIMAWAMAVGAWRKELFPEEKRGQSSGYATLFTVAFTMIPGPLLGGRLASTYGTPIVIDDQAGFVPGPLVIQVAAGLTLLAALPILGAKEALRDVPREVALEAGGRGSGSLCRQPGPSGGSRGSRGTRESGGSGSSCTSGPSTTGPRSGSTASGWPSTRAAAHPSRPTSPRLGNQPVGTLGHESSRTRGRSRGRTMRSSSGPRTTR